MNGYVNGCDRVALIDVDWSALSYFGAFAPKKVAYANR